MRWPAESQTPKLSNSQSADGPSLDKRKTFFGIGKVYLSEQQIADLKAGRGMGLALAAELNGYPGPSHLLDLASQLGLSPDQQAAIRTMFEAMKAEAIPIGDSLIGQEEALDRLFANHTVTPETLQAATARIGETQAARGPFEISSLDGGAASAAASAAVRGAKRLAPDGAAERPPRRELFEPDL